MSALMNPGSDDQMRLDAANLLLARERPAARRILIAALRSESAAARAAVCRALGTAAAAHRSILERQDFLEPLVEVLRSEQDSVIAKLAAEATLIFSYTQIAPPVEKLVADASLPVKVRLNGLYVLTLHPDKWAVIKLMELADSPEEQIAGESEKALMSLGLPTDQNDQDRKRIMAELERERPETFLRNRLIVQAQRMRELGVERDLLRKQYLTALDRIYAGMAEDAVRGRFLAGQLANSESAVKLWALEKVSQWRRGGTSDLPVDVGPVLLRLVFDGDREVRLRTARLLALMPELDSAEILARQHSVDRDPEVRLEIFVALGARCSYAAMATPQVKLPPQIVQQTLTWAAEYLFKPEPQTAQKSAEAMKKLLEREGLAPVDVESYLGLFAERYGREKAGANGMLRGTLLTLMAQLCAQGSACETEANRLFAPLFEEALADRNDLVRAAAVDGLINADRARFLLRFEKGSLIDDPSVEIRRKLIALAGSVGGVEDLGWLWEKVGRAGEGDLAWEAMVKIFRVSDATVLAQWIGRFNAANGEKRLSDDRKLVVFEIAEQKAQDRPELLKEVREKLARLYHERGDFQRAAQYWGVLYQSAPGESERASILNSLLDAYLRWPNTDRAADLIDNCLLIKDLEPGDPVVVSIEHYLKAPPAGVDPNRVVGELLAKVAKAPDRAIWQELRRRWEQRINPAKEPEKTTEPQSQR
jgi:hypothetical protein